MKKHILIALLLVLCAAGYALMPRVVQSAIPTAYYIKPSLRAYDNIVSASGVVQSEDVRQIYLQSAVIAEEVFVAVGDVVESGDLLVKIDEEQTANMATLPVSLIRDLSDEIAPQTTGTDWAALAASYGLSAAVGGAPDAAVLESLVRQETLSEAAEGIVVNTVLETEITAPIDGIVTEVAIQKGIPAGVGKAIVTIADNKNYRVIASVKEEDIARVQLDNTAAVRGVGFSGAVYSGTVTKIYPTARKALNGTASETVVDVEIQLDGIEKGKSLKPGFTAKAEISGGSDYDLITVPYEAIRQDENNKEYVYLYEEGKLQKQLVVTGKELSSEVEILDGVGIDSVVVMNPSETIEEGAMIQIRGRADAA
jgi:RND family efflux transporter MFP subunit